VSLTFFDLVNFPFYGDDPVGHDGSFVEYKSFAKALPRSARGNHPGDFIDFSRTTKPAKEFGSKRLIRVFSRKGSVEIGANELRLQWGRLNS
jgi:hypothetical protein